MSGRVVAEVGVRTDQELLAAVADGDRGALRELHDRHAPWVTARLRRRCGDPDAVADAVQDTFIAVWRGAGRWDGRGEPAAWIWGIAIRRLLSALRTRSRWDRIKAVTDRARPEVVVAAEDQVLVGVEHCVAGLASLWLATIASLRLVEGRQFALADSAVFTATGQFTAVAVALLAAAILTARSDRFATLEASR